MVQLFKVIVLMSVVLVLALVGIVHQVSWSPGQLFLHSHLIERLMTDYPPYQNHRQAPIIEYTSRVIHQA